MIKSTKVRAGLYYVSTDSGRCYSVENRQSSPAWGAEWLWYIEQTAPALDGWFDPVPTKREALAIIDSIN